MPKMIYLAAVRFPTEKAHGLQIAQNCEAFANAGYDVELWTSNRRNTPDMNAITDSHAHYGVEANFTIARVPCIDLYPLMGGNTRLEQIAFYVQMVSFVLMTLWRLRATDYDIIYSRDEWVLAGLAFFITSDKLAYEAHQFFDGRVTRHLQRRVLQQTQHIMPLTAKLRADFVDQHGADATRMLVAHDGIRAARFANMPSQAEARQQIGWDADAFIVGYVGRLHTMGMDKGVGWMAELLAELEGVSLGLVGGPDDMANELQTQWIANGADENRFLYAGQVKPSAVPTYLRALDVCAIPSPWTTRFAYYTSPLKLFEYMASGTVVAASGLLAIREVVTDGEHALLYPPEDAAAFVQAIIRLRDNPDLRQHLARQAQQLVMSHYTWLARAQAIKAHIERHH